LQEAYAEAEASKDPRKQLHASLALVPVDPGQVEYLYSRLLRAEPHEITAITTLLRDHQGVLRERLWAVLANPKKDLDQRLRTASALAAYAPDDTRWEKVSSDVAAKLVMENPLVLRMWSDALWPVRSFLLPRLATFLEEERSGPERALIVKLYGNYAQ